MNALVTYFEDQSASLRPYKSWFIGVLIIAIAILAVLLVGFRTEQGLPKWLITVGVCLMPVCVWSFGLLLILKWFSPERNKIPSAIESVESLFIIFWFIVPILSLAWLF